MSRRCGNDNDVDSMWQRPPATQRIATGITAHRHPSVGSKHRHTRKSVGLNHKAAAVEIDARVNARCGYYGSVEI